MGLSRNRISETIGNTKFGNIDTLLSQGSDMDYITGHYHMGLTLAWALRLESKGIRTLKKLKGIHWLMASLLMGPGPF